MKKYIIFAAITMIFSVGYANAGWFDPNSDEAIHQKQENLNLQSMNEVGMPAIKNFAERRQLKQIYELRDQNIPTYTYLVGLNGKVGQKLCDSVGFGIPYSTEYTNPQRTTTVQGHVAVIPQADPNTLFSPSSASGTWVLCMNPQTHKAVPLYVEPHIIVSPFPLSPDS